MLFLTVNFLSETERKSILQTGEHCGTHDLFLHIYVLQRFIIQL